MSPLKCPPLSHEANAQRPALRGRTAQRIESQRPTEACQVPEAAGQLSRVPHRSLMVWIVWIVAGAQRSGAADHPLRVQFRQREGDALTEPLRVGLPKLARRLHSPG